MNRPSESERKKLFDNALKQCLAFPRVIRGQGDMVSSFMQPRDENENMWQSRMCVYGDK